MVFTLYLLSLGEGDTFNDILS